jgi:hypothetical protein
MPAEQLTEDILNAIEDAVANGATTNKEIAKSLGWAYQKFINWKQGKRVDGENEKTKIDQAIKKGEKRQLKYFLKLAENTHPKLLTGYHEEETKTEVTKQKTKDGDEGEGEIIYEKSTTTRKYYPPNPTIVMFTEVNASNGKWKSINNKDDKSKNITINLPKGAELEIEED